MSKKTDDCQQISESEKWDCRHCALECEFRKEEYIVEYKPTKK